MLQKAKRLILTITAIAGLAMGAEAQSPVIETSTPGTTPEKVAFSHFDLGFTPGSTGIGFEVATPLTSWMDIRAGFSWFPRFNIPMTFGLDNFDTDGNQAQEKFSKLQTLMEETLGIVVDDRIDMNAKTTMMDFKLMLDFYPLPNNKHWSLTAGFYWGNSKIGHIENDILDSPTLVGVVIYNRMYDYFVNDEFFDKDFFGGISIDYELGLEMKEKFQRYGRIGVHMGNFKDSGKAYIMEPDENCMVLANMYVNHFKPYLGAGYETKFGKEQRWKFATRLGALFWGGTPDIKTHPNLNMEDNPTVNLTKDVDDIHGKVGDYVKIVKALKVYPTLNFSISYSFH